MDLNDKNYGKAVVGFGLFAVLLNVAIWGGIGYFIWKLAEMILEKV